MNLNNPLVSILIACYNHELYIKECLESILADGYQNFEIILIDDGSTDQSSEIIKEWIVKNPTINIQYESQDNIGLTKTLNKLITIAKGDYLCMLASDDKLVSGGIQKRINGLHENPTKMAIIGDAYVINSKSEIIFNSAIEDLWLGNKQNYFQLLIFLNRNQMYSFAKLYI
jgi:glycosyltransferase involved in cell wall biosynthesis